MAEETLTYLIDEGAKKLKVVNRSFERAEALAEKYGAVAGRWGELHSLIMNADLIVSTTGASEPIVDLSAYKNIEHDRFQRNLLILDLAVPRDFDPAIGECLNVYLISIDDLKQVCDRNRKAREKEWPKAERIIEHETERFMTDLNHRATGPTIRRLKEQADQVKLDELTRLYNKLGELDDRQREEVQRSFDRLVNKLLHPPLESLRDEAQSGSPHGLIEALSRLFRLKD